MKLLTCPMNGPRNISEFQYLGPVRPMPDPETTSDADWAAYLFRAENRRGTTMEWWRHTPSNYVFLAERDLGTGFVLRTVDPAQGIPE
jgi:sarcosine oxidase subunit delta